MAIRVNFALSEQKKYIKIFLKNKIKTISKKFAYRIAFKLRQKSLFCNFL